MQKKNGELERYIWGISEEVEIKREREVGGGERN